MIPEHKKMAGDRYSIYAYENANIQELTQRIIENDGPIITDQGKGHMIRTSC